MAFAPLPPDETQRILDLAKRDRAAATEAVSKLAPEAQVALVCDAPVATRASILTLLPEPEAIIPLIPEAELCFTVKALGLADAAWLLEHATPEQVTASIDLDAWVGHEPNLATFGDWIDALARTTQPALLRAVDALDPELVVLWLKSRIAVVQKPNDDESWSPPEGGQTLEGQFYYVALGDNDDLAEIATLLHGLFDKQYWTYFRVMQGVIWELESDCIEWALRWRQGRLQDLGFPPWDEAMGIYRFIAPDQRATIPEDARPLDVDAWRMPVWIPQLPEPSEAGHRLFRAVARLEDNERRANFFAFVAVANKVAVADRLELGDAESTPQAIEKAAHFISAGLAHVTKETGRDDVDVLRHLSLERLFSVGANLDPASARP